MRAWISQLDRILRGEATRPDDLEKGIALPLGGLSVLNILLAVAYGVCMGCYALFREGGPVFQQFLATSLKVAMLFVLTLVVTFPSLYVFNALVGSRLRFLEVLRLLVASLAINLAVLASLGPITAFFSVSTTSYAFMVLLNVVVFAAAGVLGLLFLLQTLNRMTSAQRPLPPPPAATEVPFPSGDAPAQEPLPVRFLDEPSALEHPPGQVLAPHVKTVFGVWVVIFALVGAQMSWVLRPFLGQPGLEFQWFRPRQSSFFEAVWRTFLSLFS